MTGTSQPWHQLVREDLVAMFEGHEVTAARLAARLAVHPRYRAAVYWRVAQAALRHRPTRALALLLTARVLSATGAELQPGARIGGGVVLKHTTGLVVGGEVQAGERLVLHQNVTLGDRRPYGGQPRIGDDVTVGAGACVLGPVSIGNRVQVAANSVVLTDVDDDCVVAGAPARVVKRRGEPVSSNAEPYRGRP
ncbi:serine O-acetyltransferase [Auraticoccus sp. F435]|uniref:Serine acetyltransferase n=1 Tax=Auraticoccus cholistanensis TaxID=2656650 RepID=A0A6A9UZ53_9ACTN|nr:DapH/DapD/GlmU-related protein [Auraticoccus cholistanensis]MVA77265.1 serine O-acetyltransferase [Auraticoccus cholistanensis]